MSSDIPPWNPIQFIAICTFTCYFSFFHIPVGGLQVASYFVCLLFLGIPAIFVQLKLGGYLQKGLVGVLSMFFPIWKGIGIVAVIDLLLQVSTMATLTAHLGTYAFIAISDHPYTWSDCKFLVHSIDDSEKCSTSMDKMVYVSKTAYRPEELFYRREFLQVSSGVETTDGFPQWRFADLARRAEISMMPVTLAIVWVLVSLFVGFGPRMAGWILFLLGPAALCSLLTTLGYGFHNLDHKPALEFLKAFYGFDNTDDMFMHWVAGFKALMYTFPMWTAICCTMGKLCGRSRKVRNMSWIMLVVVFILVSQAPTITMAPYLGNLGHKLNFNQYMKASAMERLMVLMPQAFTVLEIPQPFSFVYFLSAFLFCLMFVCIGILTIVDNMMDGLKTWIDKQACSKIAVHLLLTFFTMVVAQGIGIIMTSRAGYYYIQLFIQSFDKLKCILIILLAFGLLVVYVRQNFGAMERTLMGMWLTVSAVACTAMWVYNSYYQYLADWKVVYDFVKSPQGGVYPRNWVLVSWVIAAFPFVGIVLGLIHACFSASKSPSQKCRKLCCGVTERMREQNGDEFSPPLLPSEPSAPPYMYSYMENSNNQNGGGGGPGHGHGAGPGAYPLDHYKLDYSPTELEPLTYGDRSTRI